MSLSYVYAFGMWTVGVIFLSALVGWKLAGRWSKWQHRRKRIPGKKRG